MSDPHQPPAQPYGTPPAQPYGTPPAQPYGTPPQYSSSPQYPGGNQPASSSASASGGSLGRVALIVALVGLGIGLLVTLSFPLLYRVLPDASSIGVFGAIGNAFVLVVSVVALILGLMAARRPGQQVLAGIAIGVSASAVVGILLSWLTTLVFALTYP